MCSIRIGQIIRKHTDSAATEMILTYLVDLHSVNIQLKLRMLRHHRNNVGLSHIRVENSRSIC